MDGARRDALSAGPACPPSEASKRLDGRGDGPYARVSGVNRRQRRETASNAARPASKIMDNAKRREGWNPPGHGKGEEPPMMTS